MKRSLPILALAGLFATAPGVRAMNITPLLQDTPAQFFTLKDYEFFDAALRQALDEGREGAVVPWENAETGAGGSVTVTQEFQRQGSACKRVRLDNRARQRVGHSTFDFCRQADGRWVLPPP